MIFCRNPNRKEEALPVLLTDDDVQALAPRRRSTPFIMINTCSKEVNDDDKVIENRERKAMINSTLSSLIVWELYNAWVDSLVVLPINDCVHFSSCLFSQKIVMVVFDFSRLMAEAKGSNALMDRPQT